MGKKGIKKILAVVLAFAVVATTVFASPAPTLAAGKVVTVKTQKELDAALKSGKAKTIVIKTKSKQKLTIKGSYKNVTLKVDAPKVTIVNSAKFKGIQVKNADTITERAKGNAYRVQDKKLALTVGKDASVKTVRCDVTNGKLDLKVNGKVTDVAVNKKAAVAITGSTKSSVKVVVNAKNSSVTTKVKTAVTLKKDATVTVKKGAEGTKVAVANNKVKFTLKNDSAKEITVKTADGTTVTVNSGAKVDEKTAVVTPAPAPAPVETPVVEEKKEEPKKNDDKKEDKKDLSYDGYALKWEDNFDGETLNRDDWNVELHDPGWVNAELQAYVDSDANIQVKDGNLYLKPVQTKNEDGTYSYTSGRVNTQGKHDFTYGMFEVRAKVPTGKGYLPAFWMMPTDENLYGQWPRCGEIDCMEVMGQENNKLYGTIHFGNPHSESQGTYTLAKGNFTDEYHTFTTEWEPGCIKWYVDGVLYHTENDWYSTTVGQGTVTYPAPFDQPFYMILNLAIGGSWVGYPDENTTYDDQAFVIDYVRAYQKDSYDENVKKPVKEVVLRDPDANGNYINNGDFAAAEALDDEANWKFMTALGGEATATIADKTMTIASTNEGTVDYSVQLVQAGVPLKKGATYEVSFDAKADAARNMNVAIKAPDRGYQAYMSQNAALTTEYKPYSFTFKMTSDSDANGRLEYNMGAAGSTATIYIQNVAIKMTKDADPNEKEEKTALADGNYVYNGYFQEGEGRLAYWNISEGITAAVTNLADGRRLQADVTAGATISQTDLALMENSKYELTFDAQANEVKSVTVTVAGVKETIQLSGEKANYSMKFETAEALTNKDLVIKFNENGTYFLDNVRVVEDTLIKNGSFNAGTSGFDVYLYNTADATYVVDSLSEDNALDLTIKNTNDADWKIQLKQSNVVLEKDQCYKLSFDIKSSIARSFTYAIQRDGSVHKDANGGEDWTPYIQKTVKLEPYGNDGKYTHIDCYFQMEYDNDAGSIFNIALGGGNNKTQHRVCIDNIVLDKIAASEMPKEEEPEQSVGANLLTNGDFSNGAEGWSGEVLEKAKGAWTFDGAAQVVIETLGDATPKDYSWHVNLKQRNVTLKAGCEYEVKATITSNVDRTAEFACMDSGNVNWYVIGDNAISLKANEPKTFSFKVGVGENKTDTSAYIGFNLGKAAEGTPDASIITIDDVSMVLVSGDDSQDTDNGDSGEVGDSGETGDMKFAPGVAKVEGNLLQGKEWAPNNEAGIAFTTNEYSCTCELKCYGENQYWPSLEMHGINLEKGKTYLLSMDITSTKTRKINVVLQTGSYVNYGVNAEIQLKEDANIPFDKEFTVTENTITDGKISLGIQMGKYDDDTCSNEKITFSSVKLIECKPGEVTPPGTGDDSENNGSEEGGSEGSGEAGDSGETGDSGNTETPDEGGSTETPEQVENLVEDIKSDWSTWIAYANDPAAATIVIGDRNASVDVTALGENDWEIALEYKNKLTLKQGTKYIVSAKVNTEVARMIKASFLDSGNNWYGGSDISLNSGVNERSFTFTAEKTTSSDIKFKFSLGKMDGAATGKLVFSDISVKEVAQ